MQVATANPPLAKASRWISQVKASKDGVDLQVLSHNTPQQQINSSEDQGLPREHGRMSAYRHRMAAINESDVCTILQP